MCHQILLIQNRHLGLRSLGSGGLSLYLRDVNRLNIGRGLDPRIESGLLGIGSKLVRRDEANELLGRTFWVSKFKVETVGCTLERRDGVCLNRVDCEYGPGEVRRSRNESREWPVLDQDLGNDSDIGDSEPARVRELRGVGSLEVLDSGVRADVDLMGPGILCGFVWLPSTSRVVAEEFHLGRCPMVEAGRKVDTDAEGG